MTQDSFRERHLSGTLVELTFDSLPEQAPVLVKPVAKKRAKRTPGGLSARDRKRRQRQRDKWRAEVFELTGDQELVASVCDRASYVNALQAAARQEKRREDDTVEYRVRLCYDNGEGSSWAGTGVYGPRIIAQCFEDSQRRGNGARPRTRPKARLHENAAVCDEIIRILDDETCAMFDRILARDETSQSFTTCPVGAASCVWEAEP
jgi:DNA-binding protein H-NS